MVVRVRYGKNIRGAISYNEQKVLSSKAILIAAGRFGCDASKLSFSQKLKRFTDLNEKCVTSSYNTVHISLNFSHEDKLDDEGLQLIARDYLQAIGFDKQPYLVYRHYDTSHTHIHIVTTPVKSNGYSINLHNLVKDRSEPARKEIENSYGLVKAESKGRAVEKTELAIKKAIYGETPTKQTVAQIVRHVTENYRFSSFEQFNAVLSQFNVLADNGEPGTRINNKGGLQYFIVDQYGNKVGVPVKASAIYTNPGLKKLNTLYLRNDLSKKKSLIYTHAVVLSALNKSSSIKELTDLLDQKNIILAYDHANNPLFIDNRSKTVASLSEMNISPEAFNALYNNFSLQLPTAASLIQNLFADEYITQQVNSGFYKKKRKKKR